MSGLGSLTRALDAPVDPLAFAGDDGLLFTRGDRALAGRGAAVRIAAEGRSALAGVATEALRAIAPARGSAAPVALGALAFSPDSPVELVVPEALVRIDDGGSAELTVVGAADDLEAQWSRWAALAADPDQPAAEEATCFEVRSAVAPSAWMDSVRAARDQLRGGAARKVVLAREVVITADAPFSAASVLTRLRVAFPGCMVFSVGGFVGASPELLVSRTGSTVRSHPLAGTAARSPDPATDAELARALLASAKDREEHRITIDMVHDRLLSYCSWLDEEAEPSIVAVANVQHLGTMVEGQLSSPPASVLELLAALHPTPAVGGDPLDAALALIAEHEGFDRGPYAGAVGWVDAAGDGEWAVGIRSAVLDGTVARVFAGVGVVADSDPRAELAETRAKLQAMLAALIRP